MDKVNKFIRPLGFRRRTRSASSVGMLKITIQTYSWLWQTSIICFTAYPDNKAHSDDSSSNSKDVGVSSIYHVRTLKFFTNVNNLVSVII